jgi:hypothetical protein
MTGGTRGAPDAQTHGNAPIGQTHGGVPQVALPPLAPNGPGTVRTPLCGQEQVTVTCVT